MRFVRIETYQGPFGADTLKPTMLVCSDLCISAMKRPHPGHAAFGPSNFCLKETRPDVRNTYTGSRDEFKATQTYSKQFGEAVADMFCHSSNRQQSSHNCIISRADISDGDRWEDAGFDEPLEWLRSQR